MLVFCQGGAYLFNIFIYTCYFIIFLSFCIAKESVVCAFTYVWLFMNLLYNMHFHVDLPFDPEQNTPIKNTF